MPKTPGYLRYALYTTPIGCRSLWELSITSDTLSGSWGLNRLRLPGVVGAMSLRHLGYEESTPPGCAVGLRWALSDGGRGSTLERCFVGRVSLLSDSSDPSDSSDKKQYDLRVPPHGCIGPFSY